MEHQKSTLAIKILIFVLLALLFMLIPIKTLAADTLSFTVSSSLTECYDGEVTIITIKIFNDTGVDILPTSYYLDGSYYPISSAFMMPGQSLTITKNHTVYFGGSQSVSYDIHLVYHEDGDYDTYTAWETVTINQKTLGCVITPQPMTVITPAPTSTSMNVITPQPTATPYMDVPTPDLSNMTVVTPTPDNGIGNIGVITPAPNNLPQMPSKDGADIKLNTEEKNEENTIFAVSDNKNELKYIENNSQNNEEDLIEVNNSSYHVAGIMQNEGVKNIKSKLSSLDSFTKICLAVIAALSAGYVFLAIKLKKQK